MGKGTGAKRRKQQSINGQKLCLTHIDIVFKERGR
jgi:hypothetical protein